MAGYTRAPALAISSGLVLLIVQLASAELFAWGTNLTREGWIASADSEQPGFEPVSAIDGNPSTFWHTAYSPTESFPPHYFQVDMGQENVVNGISYQPRQDLLNNGNIGEHTVILSSDGTNWGDPVAQGTYHNDKTIKRTFFTTTTARYIRIIMQTEVQDPGNPWMSIAEFNVFSPGLDVDAAAFQPVPPQLGKWGPSLVLPIVPAAGAITADNTVLFWAAYRPDAFNTLTIGTGITQTSMWDPKSNKVSQLTMTVTHHDMFCPGIATDANGVVIVTGGNNNRRTTLYTPLGDGRPSEMSTDIWKAGALMNIGRGYQSTATLSDGRIFVIGGSWSGFRGGKIGEIYDPVADSWKLLPGADVQRILTNDREGVYRQDNHAWLYAWKENSVLSAGPSQAMTWFNVDGTGSWVDAGTRANDTDAMCAISVMFDAVNGLILAAGGAQHYEDAPATSNAHIIKIDEAYGLPVVTKIDNMKFARGFANAAVLPDGKVLVAGGQSIVATFTDTNASLPAELFDPATNKWTTVAPIIIPRNYHSIALLLPDATVLVGGGGLCGYDCLENHFDAQIYTPPYLLNSDGSSATRPTILSVPTTSLRPGDTIVATTDVEATFSLIRYGTSTHSINTDQRRVPLTTTADGLTYSAVLPSDPGILVPGYWMLFAISSNGAPSESMAIKVLQV